MKQWPTEVPTVPGLYWCRFDAEAAPEITELKGEVFLFIGSEVPYTAETLSAYEFWPVPVRPPE